MRNRTEIVRLPLSDGSKMFRFRPDRINESTFGNKSLLFREPGFVLNKPIKLKMLTVEIFWESHAIMFMWSHSANHRSYCFKGDIVIGWKWSFGQKVVPFLQRYDLLLQTSLFQLEDISYRFIINAFWLFATRDMAEAKAIRQYGNASKKWVIRQNVGYLCRSFELLL